MTERILVADDDPDILQVVRVNLELEGYEVVTAMDGQEALDKAIEAPPSLILLDIMMPRMDGLTALHRIRAHAATGNPSIILLTARGLPEDRVRGLELGADDYITKPFDADELAARVRAILQRTQPPSSKPMDVYEIGDVKINFSTHEATRDGEEVNFTALEFDILRYLIENREQTVSRKQLLKDVWGIEQEIITRTIDRHMASIRKKIENDPSDPDHIETVYGIGYRFNP